MTRILAVCALCAAFSAQASGFYFGDNGAKAMVQGGAFTAQADDLTAMHHNPAGLAKQPGFSFLADLQVLRHSVTYSRQDPGWDVNAPSTLINTVSSQTSPYFLPFFGVAYGLPVAHRNLTVGLGLFAPPSQGRYDYPMPNYAENTSGAYVENPKKFAPQRYALINTDILIAYPTLSVAYDITPWLQVGVSAQLTVSHFKQTQTMYGGDALGMHPMTQLMENPDYDATVSIDLPGQVGFTGILGVMVRPVEWLSFGASVRPPIPFHARGKFNVELPEFFKNAGARIVGDTATLDMTMPLELKFGARATPFKGFGANFDFVYQGWNSVDQLLLTPQNVTLERDGSEPVKILPFAVKKNWQPTWSVRFGASYRVIQWVSVSAGVMYETGASPTTSYSVDWTHPSRVFFTGGVTGHLGPVDVIVGMHGTPTNTTNITDSDLRRGETSDPAAPNYVQPAVVGNGIYTSGGYGVIFGLRGNFGGAPAAPKPVEPAAVPVPVETKPAPEAAPATTP